MILTFEAHPATIKVGQELSEARIPPPNCHWVIRSKFFGFSSFVSATLSSMSFLACHSSDAIYM